MGNKITLLFHSANISDAQQIQKDLNAKGIEVYPLSEQDFRYNLMETAEGIDTPVVLLLSHNWLTDTRTLYNALPALKLLNEDNRLLILMTHGITEEDGVKEEKPTRIDKIKDIIPYMKFWQEQYLREKQEEHPERPENVAKIISLSFGDIISFLKSNTPGTLKHVQEKEYQQVIKFFDLTPQSPVIQSPAQLSPAIGESPLEKLIEQEEDKKEAHAASQHNEPVLEEPDTSKSNSRAPHKPLIDQIIEEAVPAAEASALHGIETEDTPAEEAVLEWKEEGIDQIIEKAARLFDEEKDEEGFALLEKAIAEHPANNATLRYYFAYYLARRRSAFDEAIHQLDTILLHDPNNDNAYFLLAELAEIKENYALAYNYYQQTLQINPNYPHINYRIGALLQDHFPEANGKAVDYLRREINTSPDNVDALYRLGLYYADEDRDLTQAKELFEKVLELDPTHKFANYDLALIAHKEGRWEEAAGYYRQACANNPELETPENDEVFLKILAEKEKAAVETKTILITGATSGIGLATAELLAEKGNCRLILTGRRRKRLEHIVETINENYNAQATFLQFDVRDVVSVKEALQMLQPPFNEVDVLINNAGLALGLANIAEGDLKDWETMIDTNLKGLLYVTREITPQMIQRRSGTIINIGSIAGKEAYPNGNVYNATKAAVDMLTKAIRIDLHKYNIRVSQIAPGHVETEFALTRFHGDEERAKIYEDFKPLTANDIARVIDFIISQPPHVNIQDVLITSTQQATATIIDRSGRSDREARN